MSNEDRIEIATPISISLPIWMIQWIDRNYTNRSNLIRELVEAHIDESSNYGAKVEEAERKREKILSDLESINREIDYLDELRKADLKNVEIERLKRIERLKDII